MPSLKVTVTIWPSSTSSTVPRTTTPAFSAEFTLSRRSSSCPLMTPSSVLSIDAVIIALLSNSKVSSAVAVLPGVSNTVAVAVISPSSNDEISTPDSS
ncbi:hypothetical protein AN393_02824 [Pseudoalteromonas sp. P1-25]|nr:hypothetical protein AN393_02824 [Pseudoalteromonas sp. P1-25]KPZ59146.1 hypothetical protein AN389_02836 [Pseudoalteromonas sp. P1-7a]